MSGRVTESEVRKIMIARYPRTLWDIAFVLVVVLWCFLLFLLFIAFFFFFQEGKALKVFGQRSDMTYFKRIAYILCLLCRE